jgi:hypothetical protein
VTFDAASPEKLARFWALALGYADQPLPPGFSSLEEFFRSIGMPEEKLGDYWALVDPVGPARGCISSGCRNPRRLRTGCT